jgi:hypothetical protein
MVWQIQASNMEVILLFFHLQRPVALHKLELLAGEFYCQMQPIFAVFLPVG